MTVSYEIVPEAVVPRERKRRSVWNLPLETIEPGNHMLVRMTAKQMATRGRALRAYVYRQQKELKTNFSVMESDDGFVITLREE